MMAILQMARQIIRKTRKTYRKSKSVAKITKDKKGKAHCSKCGAYISR